VSDALGRIRKRGYRVVPIIDPGVKRDSHYAVYRDGLRNHAYCLNKEGKPYVGFVWPGASVFPDYSKPEARDWWAKRVARFAADGIEGVWIDMNDPSTGASEVEEMRFNGGKEDHATYHNQYALGMAKATRAGLQQAHPKTRPFVITRSGYTSINRYAAVWTGDNFSNEHHLKMSIPMSLSLALSGVPFNGPDVPGFCGNADGPLLSLWYRAGFLFPFFRNHAAWDTVRQEPWAFGKKYLQVARHYTRLRYKLMPYLYNLFIEQEQTGEAIMRPMLYDFKSRRGLSFARVGDQFMMGPALLHAPLQERGATRRDLVLPHGAWFDAMHGRWIKGGRKMQVPVADDATPLFIRDGSAVPMQRGMPVDGNVDLSRIEMHLFMSPTFRGTLTGRYCFDDGETLAYQEGQESDLSFSVRVSKGVMNIRIEQDMRDRPCRLSWVLYRKIKSIRLQVDGDVKELALKPHRWRFAGKDIQAYRTVEVVVG
jgi:alpha-glucosidase